MVAGAPTNLSDLQEDASHRVVTDAEKIIWNSKANVLYGTTSYWNSQTYFVPDAGDIIVYTDYATKEVDGQIVNIPGIKIGGGNGYVQDLVFVGDDLANTLISHINNANIHVSAQDKTNWNNKLNVNDSQEVVNETLIFNRN